MFTFPVAHFGGELSFTIDQSIRFNDGDTPSLSRTIGTPTSTQKFTFNTWIKPCTFFNDTASRAIFSAATPGNSSSDRDIIGWENDALYVAFNTGSWNEIKTSQVFRDPGSWYMITIAMDSTQASASNRTKIYVNGSQVSSFSKASYVAQNDTIAICTSGKLQAIGAYAFDITAANDRIDGYLAEINFIDGQQLAPTSFGETNSDTGQWVPVKYAGSYSGNSFHITGADSSDLGADQAGSNDFTSNLAAADQMSDSPTDNHCTLNPLEQDATGLSDGNLQFTTSSTSTHKMASGTIAVTSGKWYAEVTCNATLGSNARIGIIPDDNDNYSGSDGHVGDDAASFAYVDNGQKESNNSQSSYGASYANGDVIAIALNLDDDEVTFYKNGSSQGAISITAGKDYRFAASHYNAGGMAFNFGQSSFSSTPPTGFKALSTANLSDPGIVPSEHFSTVLYTGNGSTGQSITGVGFQPDFTWTKIRSPNAYSHQLFDAVRGAGINLQSNNANAEGDISNEFISFDSDGFTIDDVNQNVNESGSSYVSWNWKANGAGSSNGDGSVTSTVSNNSTANFSIVKYTGTGSGNSTVGHGLGVTPDMIILKHLDRSQNWRVFHTSEGVGETGFLNSTAAFSADPDRISAVSSTTFTAAANMNESADYIAYCFAEVEGFSKFTSYEGNASTDGPFIFCGFRPSFVMIKNVDAAEDWWIQDAVREPFNGGNMARISPNSSAAESDNVAWFDFVSNGLKVRYNAGGINNSGTHIVMAFAETAFKHATAR
tara:strand:+ start:4264 stop:6582 length:2319 start_codon:yes stop_codon:yes gene_type:complete